MMRVVSRDVIEHLSQTRVISSERRCPSHGDIPIAEGRGPTPFGRFRHVTAIPHAVGDERPGSTVHLASPIVGTLYCPMVVSQCPARTDEGQTQPSAGGQCSCSSVWTIADIDDADNFALCRLEWTDAAYYPPPLAGGALELRGAKRHSQ
jgi:hypothetical protein